MSDCSTAPFPIAGTRFVSAEPRDPIGLAEQQAISASARGAGQPPRKEVPVGELSFRHLKTLGEIARISHLREEIQLPASVVADPCFRAREKKGIAKASWAPSNAVASLSEPSASSRWIADWPLARRSCSGSRCCRRIFTKEAGR